MDDLISTIFVVQRLTAKILELYRIKLTQANIFYIYGLLVTAHLTSILYDIYDTYLIECYKNINYVKICPLTA